MPIVFNGEIRVLSNGNNLLLVRDVCVTIERLKYNLADDAVDPNSFPYRCVVGCQGHASNKKTVLVRYLYVERLSESVNVDFQSLGDKPKAISSEESHRRDPRFCVQHHFAHFPRYVDPETCSGRSPVSVRN